MRPPQPPTYPPTFSMPPRRVLLKLSGEALAGAAGVGVDPGVLRRVACEVAAAVARGVEASGAMGAAPGTAGRVRVGRGTLPVLTV